MRVCGPSEYRRALPVMLPTCRATGRMTQPRQTAGGEKKRFIFVMGVQRSGTNALRRSLSLSPGVIAFNEAEDSEYFHNWYLRPEPDIREHLMAVPLPVLFKPISETLRRPLADIIEEYADYDLSVVWIYRDPLNVYYSTAKRWLATPVGRRRLHRSMEQTESVCARGPREV